MSIRQMVENRVWDEVKQEWVLTAPKTHAAAVETAGGSTVQAELDAIPSAITTAKESAVAEIRAGVATEGDTLSKLYTLISNLQDLTQSDDFDLDTVQEIVSYIKENRDDLTLLGQNKVAYTDIVNALDTVSTIENKALDARQGKVLKDAIDALEAALNTFKGEAEDMVAAALPVVSETAPTAPINGQLWFKPAGTIEINE